MAPSPIIMAHRGLTQRAPENTLAAFAAALELGFGLELDLRLTSDHRVVVIHDPNLERTTNGHGLVSQRSLAEIRTLDAGSWFDPCFSGQHVPTLEEVLGLIREQRRPPTLVALELKTGAESALEWICEEVAYRELVREVVAIGRPVWSPETRRRLKGAQPALPMSARVDSPRGLGQALADESVDWLYIRFPPTRKQVADAHARGKRVLKGGPLPDEVDPDHWRGLRQVGIDAILTDFPIECARALRSSGDPEACAHADHGEKEAT